MKKKFLLVLMLLVLSVSFIFADYIITEKYIITVHYTEEVLDYIEPAWTEYRPNEPPIHHPERKYYKTVHLTKDVEKTVSVTVKGTSPEELRRAKEQLEQKLAEAVEEINSAYNQYDNNVDYKKTTVMKVGKTKILTDKLTDEEKKNIEIGMGQVFPSFSVVQGDPVRVSTGEFILKATDIELSSLFKVKKEYRSQLEEESLFGIGFYSNLDSRIYRGVRPDVDKEYHNIIAETDSISLLIKERENKTAQAINTLKGLMDEHKVFIDKCKITIESLSSTSTEGIKELQDRINNDIAIVRAQLNSSQSEYNKYKAEIEKLQASYFYIDGMKSDLQTLEDMIPGIKRLKNHADSNKALNIYTKGIQDKIGESGNRTIVWVDESSIPHIFTLPEPDYNSLLKYEGTDITNFYPNGAKLTAKSYYDNYELYLKSDGCFVLTNEQKRRYTYNLYGQLVKVEDKNGQFLDIYYTTNVLSHMIDYRNRKITFTIEEGRISSVADPLGNETKYFYDEQGRLISFIDRDGDTVRYSYDGISSRLTKIVKPDNSFIEYKYKEINGLFRVVSTVNEEGYAEYFDYNFDQGVTVYTDQEGVVTKHFFNEQMKETKVVYNNGSEVKKIWDSYNGKILSVTNQLEEVTSYQYQDFKLTNSEFSDNSEIILEYNDSGDISYTKDREGYETWYNYNGNNTIESKYLSGNKEIKYEYDNFNRVVSEKVNQNNKLISETRFDYDDFYDDNQGTVKEITDPDGVRSFEYINRMGLTDCIKNSHGDLVYSFKYNNNGKLIEKTYHVDNSTEKYIYSNRKDLVYKKDRNGVVTLYRYDKTHQLLKVLTLKKGLTYSKEEVIKDNFKPLADDIFKEVSFTYRKDGKVTEKKIDNIKTNIYLYNENGWLELNIVKESGNVEEYLYDSLGRVITKNIYHLDLKGEDKLINYIDIITNNRPFSSEEYEYDSNNNIAKVTFPDKTYEELTYTANGKIKTRVGKKNKSFVTTWTYDFENGTEIAEDPEGIVSYFKKVGNKTWTGNSLDESKCTIREFYPSGRLKKVLYPVDSDGNRASETYLYNEFGYLETKIDMRGTKWFNTYDIEGKLLTKSNDYGYLAKYTYENGQLKAVDINGNTFVYEYNEVGDLINTIDPYENTTSSKYNALGFITENIDANGNSWKYDYTVDGKVVSIINPEGEKTTYNHLYNIEGIIAEKRKSGLDFTNQGYREYINIMGYITKTLDEDNVETNYKYDEDGNLIKLAIGDGKEYIWEYDERGRLSKETNRFGEVKSYKYDNSNNLIEYYDFGESSPVVIEYNNRGNIIRQDYPDGTFRKYSYSIAGDLVEAETNDETLKFKYNALGQLFESSSSRTSDILKYKYDSKGNRTEILINDVLSTKYEYGKINEVLKIINDSRDVSFEYDKDGREVLRKSLDDKTIKTYDKAGRVRSIKHCDGYEIIRAEAYQYNKNGLKSHMIDERGNITSYNYTNAGRLNEVSYPLDGHYKKTAKDEYLSLGLLSSKHNQGNWKKNKRPDYDYELKKELIDTFELISKSWMPTPKFNKSLWSEKYLYNNQGNKISKSTDLGKIDYIYVNNNLVKAGNKSLEYDKRGNLISESVLGTKKSYSYDLNSRIVKYNDGIKTVKYSYDALGRRSTRDESINKDTGNNNKHILSNIYLYEGKSFNITKEFIGNKVNLVELQNIASGYNNVRGYNDIQILENSYHGVIPLTTKDSRWHHAKSHYYLHDSLGSVIGVETYNNVRPIRYNAYGTDIKENQGPGYFGYNGKPYDNITGLNNYGFRDYSSTLGIFITVDPIKDNINWYTYVNNDPINYKDIYGLDDIHVGDNLHYNPTTGEYYNSDGSSVKEDTKIEITRRKGGYRDEDDQDFYNDTIEIKNNDLVLTSSPVQSEADIPEPQLTNDYNGWTIDPQSYTGTLLTNSGSYSNPIRIFDNFLIHPNMFTNPTKVKAYLDKGKSIGPWRFPYSAGCQIPKIDDFNELVEVLKQLGFEFNNKDQIKIDIKEN